MFHDAARLTSYQHTVKHPVTLKETHSSSFTKQNSTYTAHHQATHSDPEDGGIMYFQMSAILPTAIWCNPRIELPSITHTFLLHFSQWYASAPSNSSPLTYCSSESSNVLWFRMSTLITLNGSSFEYLRIQLLIQWGRIHGIGGELCEIWSLHCNHYLLGHDAIQLGISLQTFWRDANMLLPDYMALYPRRQYSSSEN